MTHRYARALPLLAAALLAMPAAARTKQLTSASEVLSALRSGEEVRAVLHYREMKLTTEEGEEAKAPDATGGMVLQPWEYFAAGVVGNPVGYLVCSETRLIRHPRHGHVLNYVKLSLYDDGQVKILAQYLTPSADEVRMSETFTTRIADGKNGGGAFFFLER